MAQLPRTSGTAPRGCTQWAQAAGLVSPSKGCSHLEPDKLKETLHSVTTQDVT